MKNIREHKIELRKYIEQKRADLSPAARAQKEKLIQEQLIKHCGPLLLDAMQSRETSAASGACLLTYMPFRTEADVTPLMEWCWQQGICVLVPRVDKETKSMALYGVNGYTDLETGAWGIREPKSSLAEERDLSAISMVLVPGLAFDRELGRLGYGGGFYDRFMQLFDGRGLSRPFAVAAAFDVQVVPQVPASWHDFRLDALITETLYIHKGKTR